MRPPPLRVRRTRAYARQVTCNDPERIHEHEKPRAPEQQQPVEDPAAPLHEFVSNVGNRAFGGAIARSQGAGIMPSGEVHPSVQSTIDSTRGGGTGARHAASPTSSRPRSATSRMSACTPTQTAHDLNHAVSARAFATGTDVYFAQDQYKPNTSDGDKLIAHELAHVVQQRGAPTSGPLTVSNPGDSMEREADDVADKIAP